MLPHADPIHKVTIIPRGMALGLTQQLPIDEKHNYSREYLEDQIAILLGGRIAEEITHRQHHDRRRQRPRARHRPGAPDGLRVGHERRDGSAHLRQEGRADLPRPRDRAAPGLQRGHRAPHRPGSEAVRHRQLHARAERPRSSTSRSCSTWPTRCSRARRSTPSRCRRIAAGLPLDELRAGRRAPRRRRRASQARQGAAPAVDRAAASAAAGHAGISSKFKVQSSKYSATVPRLR